MKQYRGRDGQPRIWYDQAEIEYMMEDELHRAGLYPTPNQPVVDVERLLESHLGVKLDQYADLDETVLGVTTFVPGQRPKVEINKDLTGAVFDDEDSAPGLLGRWRASLAHEAAHVIMHRVLFELPLGQQSFFVQERRGSMLMRCLKRDVGFGRGRSDWCEVQANKGMAALLMPRRLVAGLANQAVTAQLGGLPTGGSHEGDFLAAKVGELFQVSRQAATIRLEELGILVPAGQGQLGAI